MDFLQHARPTKWSETTSVKVDQTPSFVYAGEPVEVREIEISEGRSVKDGEPSLKVAAGKYVQKGDLGWRESSVQERSESRRTAKL